MVIFEDNFFFFIFVANFTELEVVESFVFYLGIFVIKESGFGDNVDKKFVFRKRRRFERIKV